MYTAGCVTFGGSISVSARQITRLYCRFSNLDKANKGYLSREDFEHIPELAINPLGDRIIEAFVEGGQDDRVNFKQFVSVLARFRPVKKGASRQSSLNTTEEKLRCKSPTVGRHIDVEHCSVPYKMGTGTYSL